MMLKMQKLIIISIIFSVVAQAFGFTQVDTIFAEYKYIMGDNDTKAEARQLTFLYAKKACLEKAGTYVSAEFRIIKSEKQGALYEFSELTEQDITTYASAFVKVDVLSENYEYVGQSIAITTKVRAIVNVDSIFDRIIAIESDNSQAEQLKDQQVQLEEMESNIRELQKKLTSGQVDLVENARIKRHQTFGKISELEKIKEEITHKTQLAVENVELLMTPEEVEMLIGQPRSKVYYNKNWNYGKVWIVFENGLVSCIVRADCFRSRRDRYDYESYNPQAIIK